MLEKISNADDSLFIWKTFENANRLKECITLISEFCVFGKVLKKAEYIFIGKIFKSVALQIREACQKLQVQLSECETSPKRFDFVKDVLTQTQRDLVKHCTDVIALVKDNLLTDKVVFILETSAAQSDVEYLCFLYKLVADYYRYLCECTFDDEKSNFIKLSHWYYTKSYDHSSQLSTDNEIRLGLILNYSVFLYDIIHARKEALKLSHEVVEETQSYIESLDPKEKKLSNPIGLTMIMENIDIWSAETSD